jgi:hypothetical protein
MSLSTEERIATTGMLIEREAVYARVAEIETEINQLFQGAYPFPAPESIPPSLSKRKAKQAPKAKAAKPPGAPVIKLRRLREGECAYRYVWLAKGAEQNATSIDARLVETFIKSPPPGIQILRVETVDIESIPQETLYERQE